MGRLKREGNRDGSIPAYFKLAEESKGFEVNEGGRRVCGGIAPWSEGSSFAAKAAKFAVEMHNKEHNSNLILYGVVRANGQCVGGLLIYITLKVRLPNEKHSKVYQAKVYYDPSCKLELDLFREQPPRPKVQKGAILIIMHALRKHPLVKTYTHREVTKIASYLWKSMSPRDKVRYYNKRSLKFVDTKTIMKASGGKL